MFFRKQMTLLTQRLTEKRRFIQVISGPRQTGKTTLVKQALDTIGMLSYYATADTPMVPDRSWIKINWTTARAMTQRNQKTVVLVLDEIQKISDWSTEIKAQWDQDTRENNPIQVVILGSAPLLIQAGLTESLAGRFEIIPVQHWSFAEMQSAFQWDLDQYNADIYYWREGDDEVDYVVASGEKLFAIEVKSGRKSYANHSGLIAFSKKFPNAELLQVGAGGIPLQRFLMGEFCFG